MAKAVDQEISMVDGCEQCLVLTPGAQTAHSASRAEGVFLNIRCQLFHPPAIVHAGQAFNNRSLLFCDTSAREIVAMLERECTAAGVRILAAIE